MVRAGGASVDRAWAEVSVGARRSQSLRPGEHGQGDIVSALTLLNDTRLYSISPEHRATSMFVSSD
jgi:hypothetical protein